MEDSTKELIQAQIRSVTNSKFHDGDRITNKSLKSALASIYRDCGFKGKAKGTDIIKYGFVTKKCKIRIEDKRVDGVILQRLDSL